MDKFKWVVSTDHTYTNYSVPPPSIDDRELYNLWWKLEDIEILHTQAMMQFVVNFDSNEYPFLVKDNETDMDWDDV